MVLLDVGVQNRMQVEGAIRANERMSAYRRCFSSARRRREDLLKIPRDSSSCIFRSPALLQQVFVED